MHATLDALQIAGHPLSQLVPASVCVVSHIEIAVVRKVGLPKVIITVVNREVVSVQSIQDGLCITDKA
jgi:hypothetical protein